MPPPRDPTRRWPRRVAYAIAAIVAAAGVAVWLLRDLPRAQVERGLADRLEANVDVGAFEIEGARRFVLHDLVLTRVAGQPRVRRVSVATLVVVGSPPDLLAGRFEAVEADGIELRVGPPDPGIPEPTAPPAEIVADRVRLSRVRVIVGAADEEASIEVDGEITGVGGDMAGALRARSESVPIAAVLGLVPPREGAPAVPFGGGVEGLEATVRFAEGESTIDLEARARRVRIERGPHVVDVPDPALAAHLAPDAAARSMAFEAKATLAGIEEARARGTWDERGGSVSGIEGRVRGLDLARWLPIVPGLPDGVEAEGRVDLEIAQRDASAVGYVVEGAIARARLPAGALGSSGPVEATDLEIHLAGQADAARLASGGPFSLDLSARLVTGAVAGYELPGALFPLRVQSGGRAMLEGGLTVTGRARVAASDVVLDLGDLDVRLGDTPRASGRFELAPIDIDDALLVAGAAGVALPSGLDMTGTLVASGSFSYPATAAAPRRATIAADRLTAAVREAGAEAPAFVLRGASARIDASWPGPGSTLLVKSAKLEGALVVEPLSPIAVTASASARLDPAARRVEEITIAVEAEGLARANVTASGDLASGGTAAVRVEGIDVTRWQEFLRPLIGDIAPGFSGKGSAVASVNASLRTDGTWNGTGTATIGGSGFSSDDGARVVEGLDTTWELALEGEGLESLRGRAKASVGGFQLLWGSFFADYSGVPSTITTEGRLDRPRGSWDGRVVWSFPAGPTLALSLSHDKGSTVAYEADVDVAEFGETLARYLRAPLGDSVPWFTRIEGEGRVHASARGIVEPGRIEAAGRIGLDGVRLEGTRGFVEVRGLDLELPFDVSVDTGTDGRIASVEGPPLTGKLGFSSLAVGGLELSRTETALSVRSDAIGLEEPLAVLLLGGVVGFEQLRFVDALRPSRRLETAVLISKIDLVETTRAFELPRLEGAVDGYFPRVVLTGPELLVDGGGEIDLFGGKVRVDGISGEDLLTRFPRISLSTEFEGIDLSQVTRTFDFGDISGVVDGYVRHVQLFRGVPTRFDARVKSVDQPSVSRRINVKAINNIAILGGGGKVGVLDRGIHKFFDSYTYESLGLTVQLFNDRFLMRGLERRGGKELFIKGRFPFPIDVVNATPGGTVSFRGMLERIRNLDAGAVKRGPTK